MKQNSCIVVTGANGLAGSAVVEHFRKREFTCVVPLTREDADLMHAEEVMETFARVKPEYVFHAAATVYGLQGNMDNQYKSIFENTLINTNVIHASRLVGVKKIVAMGTNAVYPSPAQLPYREETIFDGRPHDGEAGYAHAKRHMLALLEAAGIPYVYLVSGNLYGPRDTFDPVSGHVLPSMIHKFYEASINKDAPVSLWGSGEATRDFLYSEDLAEGVRFMLGNKFVGPVNIGSGTAHHLTYIAKRLSGISGVGYERVQWDTTKPEGRLRTFSDLSLIRDLGWKPYTEIGEGLRETFEWYSTDRNSSVKLD